MIDRLENLGALGDTVADLEKKFEKRFDNLEEQLKSKKRVSFYQSNHVKLIPKLEDSPDSPTQPSTRSTRSRSGAQESTPVPKRTTRSMSRKNEK